MGPHDARARYWQWVGTDQLTPYDDNSLVGCAFQLKPRLLLPSPRRRAGQWNLRCRIMGHHLTRFVYGLSRKLHLGAISQPHTPQTSLSASSRISSLDRNILIYSIQFSQLWNSQTSSSFPSSLTSAQTRDVPVTTRSSVFMMNW